MNRLGAAALIVAALAAGRAVTTLFPADTAISEPFVRSGTVGHPTHLRYADITAGSATGSTCAGTMRTPGLFLVVPLKITARGEPAEIRYAAVQDRIGRTFLASGTRSSFIPGTAQPGVPHYASVLVELPRDAVAGVHVRVALNQLDQRRDDLADIDLRLSEQDLERWTANSTRLTVPDASDQPPTTKPGPRCP